MCMRLFPLAFALFVRVVKADNNKRGFRVYGLAAFLASAGQGG